MRTGLNILIDEERSNHARQYFALTARLSRNVMSALRPKAASWWKSSNLTGIDSMVEI
jgi:hypothetical protein